MEKPNLNSSMLFAIVINENYNDNNNIILIRLLYYLRVCHVDVGFLGSVYVHAAKLTNLTYHK